MDSEPPRTGTAAAIATAADPAQAHAVFATCLTPASTESRPGSSTARGGVTDESYSPEGFLDPGSPLLGAAIALLALIVPVAAVLLERSAFRADPSLSIPVSRGYQQPDRLPLPGIPPSGSVRPR